MFKKKESSLGKKILYFIYLIIIIFLGLEIALRIFNPFHFRLKGDKIVLPVNQTAYIKNTINQKLDSIIVNTRNSLGFRGPEKPPDYKNMLSIITVGGSTTECHFLNDDKTWPFLTAQNLKKEFKNIWLNNAGLDGHSTFGHQVLLNDYLIKLRPKIILFLIGINDVENDQPSFHDKLNTRGTYPDFKHYIFENSEVLNLILNYSRGWRAQKFNNTTQKELILDKKNNLTINDEAFKKRIAEQQKYLTGYTKRIEELIDTCRWHNIEPVLITQPNLFGIGTDSMSGINLETFKLDNDLNGKLLWKMLEVYNDVTRKVCAAKSVTVIDLAGLMPKNSLYFYDGSHFTNDGAKKVADIVFEKLRLILSDHFPGYILKKESTETSH